MNQRRSRTAEDLYRNTPGLDVRSAGTWPDGDHHIEQQDIDWADTVLVMEDEHREEIVNEFGTGASLDKLTVLGMRDEWLRGDPELKGYLRARIDPLIARNLDATHPKMRK